MMKRSKSVKWKNEKRKEKKRKEERTLRMPGTNILERYNTGINMTKVGKFRGIQPSEAPSLYFSLSL